MMTIEKILLTKGMFVGGLGAKLKLIARDSRRTPAVTVTVVALETRTGRQKDGTFGGSWLHVQREGTSETIRIPKDSDLRVELVSAGTGERLPNANVYWDIRRKNQKSGRVLREFTKETVNETNRNTEVVINRTLQAQMAQFQSHSDAQLSQAFEMLGSEVRKVMTVSVHTAKRVVSMETAIKALAKELGLNDAEFENIIAKYQTA